MSHAHPVHRRALSVPVALLFLAALLPTAFPPSAAAQAPAGPPPACIPTTPSHDTDGAPIHAPHDFCWSSSHDGLSITVGGGLGRGQALTVSVAGDLATDDEGNLQNVFYQEVYDNDSPCAAPEPSSQSGWFVYDCRDIFGHGSAFGSIRPVGDQDCDDRTSCTFTTGSRIEDGGTYLFVNVSALVGDGPDVESVVVTAPVPLHPEAGGRRPLGVPVATREGRLVHLDASGSLARLNGPPITEYVWVVHHGTGGGGAEVARSNQPVVDVTLPDDGDFEAVLHVTDAEGESDTQFVQLTQEAPAPPPAAFTWEVRPRLEEPDPGVVPDLPDTAEEVQHEDFPVDFTVVDDHCVDGVEWVVDGVATPAERIEPCVWSIAFPDEGEREVALRIAGEVVHAEPVDVQDQLILVLGDSIPSGEGNPDATTVTDPSTYPEGRWIDEACHRSLRSGYAQAAVRMERDDPHSSVTLVHLACSGATTRNGLLGPQLAGGGQIRAAQIAQATALIGDREVDAALVTIGGNDLHFAAAALFCSANGYLNRGGFFDRERYYTPCYDLYMSTETDLNISYRGIQVQTRDSLPIPEGLDRVLAQLCVRADVGDRSIVVDRGEDLSDDYLVTMNYGRADYGDREPTGPSTTQDTRIQGRVHGAGCGSGSGAASGSINPLFVGGSHGVRAGLADALVEPHPTRYFPENALVDGLPVEPTEEVILLEPEFTLSSLIRDQALPELEDALDELGPRLASLVDPARTFVVEYPDPLTSQTGANCQQLLTLGVAPDSGIDAAESRWARAAILGRLNTALHSAAADHGWTFVPGPATVFIGHGMCSTAPWFHDVQSSLEAGAGFRGPIHPNAAGHATIADIIVAAVVDGVLGTPATYEDVDETETDYTVLEFLEAGDNLIYVEPDVESEPIEPGDVLLIEYNQVDELVQALGLDTRFAQDGGPTAIRLAQPLANDYPPGARVRVITPLDELPPPEGPEVQSFITARSDEAERRRIMTTAAEISLYRFPDPAERPPAHAVLARVDAFADALAGSALTTDAPLLLTPGDELEPLVAEELQRVLPDGGTVHLLGGEAAITPAVSDALAALGFEVRRLAGPSRVETALAVADVIAAGGDVTTVGVARSTAPAGNPTAAWADSVAGGAWAADTGTPILLTPGDTAHAAVTAWLADHGVTTSIVLGGTAAVDEGVLAGLPGGRRVSGPSRAETAIAIADELWSAPSGGYVLVDGFDVDGWAYGLAGAGVAADLDRPVLLSSATALPSHTDALVAGCPDLAVVGLAAAPACWEGEPPL